jgi:hypothetical protein
MQNALPDSAGKRYVKRPVVIEAMQWTGSNIHELWDWIGADNLYGPVPLADDADHNQDYHAEDVEFTPAKLYVAANDAWLDLEIGEWILKDKLGFYPCKDSVFVETYAPDDGSGILVIPPGLMDQIRNADYDVKQIQSKQTTVSTDFQISPFTLREQLVTRVEHTVDITAERTRG